MAWYHRVRNVFRPGRHSRDIAREMEFHVAERRDQLVAQGMDPESAAHEAEKRFGNRLLQAERTRDADVAVWLESLVADLKYAGRGLRRDPGFAAVAILSLALGIGANTALFSLANALLLRNLPVRAPEQLVLVDRGKPDSSVFTNPIWEAIRDRQKVFSGAFAYTDQRFNLADSGPARRANGALVGGAFFETLGVRPAAGRLLTAADDVRGCPALAVVSAAFADRELGGVAAATGRSLSLSRHPFTVVGVADPAFTGIQVGSIADVYVPLCANVILRDNPTVLDRRSMWYVQIVGRRLPGLSPEAAAAGLAAIAPEVYAATVPDNWAAEDRKEFLENKLAVTPAPRGLSDLRDQYGKALNILLAVVGVVLLVSCANIANLMLARAAARRGENALRRALGAGGGRLVRQQLSESLLLSLTGGAVGALFGRWASALLFRFVAPPGTSSFLDLSLDARVLGFTLVVSLVTGLLFGLVPARFAARSAPIVATGGVRGRVDAHSHHRAGKALVVGQVALSLVLVAAAALLVGSFRRLATVDPGFRAPGVLVVDADFSGEKLEGEALEAAKRNVLEALRALPDADSASASQLTPFGRMRWNELLVVPGYTAKQPFDAMAYFNGTSDGYLATLGTPLLEGRDFATSDRKGAPDVAIVNRAFARKFFGEGSPLGRTFATQIGDGTNSAPIEVIGVSGDAKYSSLEDDAPPAVIRPAAQVEAFGGEFCFEVRTSRPPEAMIAQVKSILGEVAPATSFEARTLSSQLDRTLARPRVLATLSGFFGLLALLLAMIGLYGTLAYAVTRRRGEIGVRMALGAAASQVLGMIVSEAGRLVILGVVLGAGLTLAATRWLTSFLYGVTPTDPKTLTSATVLLGLAALGAALLPALRATRVEPSEILRD